MGAPTSAEVLDVLTTSPLFGLATYHAMTLPRAADLVSTGFGLDLAHAKDLLMVYALDGEDRDIEIVTSEDGMLQKVLRGRPSAVEEISLRDAGYHSILTPRPRLDQFGQYLPLNRAAAYYDTNTQPSDRWVTTPSRIRELCQCALADEQARFEREVGG